MKRKFLQNFIDSFKKCHQFVLSIGEIIFKDLNDVFLQSSLKKIYMKWYGVDLTVDNTAKKK